MDKGEKLKIILEEITELHRQQQSGVDLTYNKLNWILVSDLVFLAVLLTSGQSNILVVLLVSLSAVVTLFGFRSRSFKFTQKILDQIEKIGSEDFLMVLVDKKRQALNSNTPVLKELIDILLFASSLLITAIAIQFLLLL